MSIMIPVVVKIANMTADSAAMVQEVQSTVGLKRNTIWRYGMMALDSLDELYEKYPQYPEDMRVFKEFIQTHKNQLLLLREEARVNNNTRLHEAIQNLFEDYFQYTHDRTLYDHFNLEVDGYYDDYLCHSVIEAAEKVRDHYAPMWDDSRGIPLDHTRRHYSAGVIRWGSACSMCNRLATDLKSLEGEK